MSQIENKTSELNTKKGLNNSRGSYDETLFSWLFSQGKTGFKNSPIIAKTILIQISIVLFFQVIFWWRTTSQYIPDIIKTPVIFLTATYNDIIPKTLYWIIVFTFGKKLFNRIRKTGFQKAMRPISWLIPEFKKKMEVLNKKAYSILLIGGGFGLIIANNFASYSRFSGARNKFDKYFVVILISFTVSYLLGEGRKHWIFKFHSLAASDFSRMFKIKNSYSDDHTYVLLSGFVAGLLLDAPLILMKLKYAGYILGGILIIMGIGLKILLPIKSRGTNDYIG